MYSRPSLEKYPFGIDVYACRGVGPDLFVRKRRPDYISHSLSGCPPVTDLDVKTKSLLIGFSQIAWRSLFSARLQFRRLKAVALDELQDLVSCKTRERGPPADEQVSDAEPRRPKYSSELRRKLRKQLHSKARANGNWNIFVVGQPFTVENSVMRRS